MSGCLAVYNQQLATEITVVNDTTVSIPSGFPTAATDNCTCVYQGIEKQIPYADFKRLNSDLAKNLPEAGSTSSRSGGTTTTAIPSKVQKIVDECQKSSPPPAS